jgi:hypothetical protein
MASQIPDFYFYNLANELTINNLVGSLHHENAGTNSLGDALADKKPTTSIVTSTEYTNYKPIKAYQKKFAEYIATESKGVPTFTDIEIITHINAFLSAK